MAKNKRRPQKRGHASPNQKRGSNSGGGGAAAKREARERIQRQAELKRKGSWAVLFGGIALVVGIIVIAVLSSVSNSNAGVADPNAWELPTLYGDDQVTLASLQGKPVVVNFFASWCTACEAELPDFHAAVEEFGDEINFVFVDSQDSDRLGKEMAERHDIDGFTVLKDFGSSNSAMFRALGGQGMPITAFYDADGTLRQVTTGALVGGRLDDSLREFGYVG